MHHNSMHKPHSNGNGAIRNAEPPVKERGFWARLFLGKRKPPRTGVAK